MCVQGKTDPLCITILWSPVLCHVIMSYLSVLGAHGDGTLVTLLTLSVCDRSGRRAPAATPGGHHETPAAAEYQHGGQDRGGTQVGGPVLSLFISPLVSLIFFFASPLLSLVLSSSPLLNFFSSSSVHPHQYFISFSLVLVPCSLCHSAFSQPPPLLSLSKSSCLSPQPAFLSWLHHHTAAIRLSPLHSGRFPPVFYILGSLILPCDG